MYTRRATEVRSADDLGALDPAAIQRVREEAWPVANTPDEMYDALMVAGYLRQSELAAHWHALLAELGARAVRKDIDTLWEAVKAAKRPRIHTFLGTSDIHIQKKFRSDRDKILQWCVDTVKYARSLCPDVEFSTEDASRTDFEFLCRSVEAIVKAGAFKLRQGADALADYQFGSQTIHQQEQEQLLNAAFEGL